MAERPTIVLLHGGPGADHTLFKPELSAAAGFAQVIYLDQRGSGRSVRSGPLQWTWDRWADDAIDFCDALEIERPVLVGTSSGGWIALLAAIRHPDRFAGLVLDSVMPGDAYERLEMFERLGGPEARDVALRYWAGDTGDEMTDAWERICLPLYSQQDGDGQDRLRRVRWNDDVLDHFRLVLAREFDPWYGLDRLACRTMILAGEHDPVATASAARRFAHRLSHTDVRLHVLARAGHGVFREAPKRAMDLLREFVVSGHVPRLH
ncbi:alpha/beta fold hydrolase [Streptomyces purpurogeneiscleroticus]|uniref:alpha/beta fold hydrolase n=1 Tax=Streptomyces purpurogeneiscleroticus TaxID=68259 RepID=UPI001CBDBF6A|nr:alpha/beta hydrolase [Streptomyces purpurogeneiscleroticus]